MTGSLEHSSSSLAAAACGARDDAARCASKDGTPRLRRLGGSTNALLGGSFGSRITRNIREDKGYTYSPGSSVSSRFRNAYWAESAAIQTPSTGPAIAEILYEIDSLATTPPSAATPKRALGLPCARGETSSRRRGAFFLALVSL